MRVMVQHLVAMIYTFQMDQQMEYQDQPRFLSHIIMAEVPKVKQIIHL